MMLKRGFYTRDVCEVARALLGCVLVRAFEDGERVGGRIVETEAYLGAEDKAAHTFKGRRTKRNEAMFLKGGHSYVYFTYGMHYCFNVTTGEVDEPKACLIRAIEPLEGLERMYANRAGKIERSKLKERDLCSGPAKLCQALGIDKGLNMVDLVGGGGLWIERGTEVCEADIVVRPRVGVGYAEEWADKPYRYYLRNNGHVSVK